MRLKDYDEKDGKRVWLGNDELDAFLEKASNPEQRLAFMLGARGGLRREEILNVTPEDFVTGPTGGQHVRVWAGKGDKYREPPVPDTVDAIASTLAYDQADDEPLVSVNPSTLYRWVKRAAAELEDETGDVGWSYLDVHDLRRTWGVNLLEQGVIPAVVMEWGGWADWETFRDHYLSELSPEGLKREREKVDFLGGHGSGGRSSGFEPRGERSEDGTPERVPSE